MCPEAMQWMNELDKKYQLTDDEYGMGDFIDELKEKGYITGDNQPGQIKITPKTEQGIRKRSLEEIFGKLKKTKQGDHHSFKPGKGDEQNPETRQVPVWRYAGTNRFYRSHPQCTDQSWHR
jgi:hypothetical protein